MAKASTPLYKPIIIYYNAMGSASVLVVALTTLAPRPSDLFPGAFEAQNSPLSLSLHLSVLGFAHCSSILCVRGDFSALYSRVQ